MEQTLQQQISNCQKMINLIGENKVVGMTEGEKETLRIALINHLEYLKGLVPIQIVPFPGNI